MNADRWREVNALFHAALDLEGDAREALLRRTAETDPALCDEVRSLIARHKNTEGFLEKPAWAVASDLILGSDTPDGSLVGKQIGSYTILEEVGRGGMGVVYAARDERLGRTVALKALPPEYISDRRYRDRLAREARAAAAFAHESIATIYALEEIDGELFIASEFVEGETLRDELGRGPTPPDRLLPTLVDIASGLAAAHNHGIIHRDLKPENVIRRTDGHIKILDFGLARMNDPQVPTVTRLTEPGTAPGTPGYMAPEQMSGGDVDARTDLFAFGVLAWELATGEHPFGPNPAVMLARMMEGRPASLTRQLSVAGLDAIVRRCLRAAPADRYGSAEALLEDLRRLSPSGAQRVVAEAAVPAGGGLWWWQFHQATMTAVDISTPILAALVRGGIGRPYGTWIFFAVLALATAAVTLRLNLLFTARVHPAILPRHRSKLFRWIAPAEFVLALTMLGSAITVNETNPIVAAIQISLAIVMVASLTLIEPATTGGAGLENDAI
ncbi:MAG TPA: serine/threonine-protein kinase [Vicinamibacterales bacterium]